MNQTQKNALYGLYLTGFLLLIPLIDLVETKISFYLWQPIILIGVFLLVVPIYYMKKCKDKTFDELDKKICIRAGIFATLLSCTTAIFAYILVLFAFESFSLNSDNLAVILYSGAILFIASISLAVLFQYHRLNKIERSLS